MLIADENHTKFHAAISGLHDVRKTIDETDWLINLAKMIILARMTGDVMSVAALFSTNETRIQQLQDKANAAKEHISTALVAVELAKTLIPNTIPPHPEGFESCSV